MRTGFLLLSVAAVAACTATPPQGGVAPELAAYVDTMSAIDSHAHPMTYVAAGSLPDSEYDALPLDALPPFEVPYGLRATQPLYAVAQRALYGISDTDTGAPRAAALLQARTKMQQQQSDKFPVWALDRLHIDVMLANRVAMGPGLTSTRFRWVAFADALVLPLDGSREAGNTPDTKSLYPLEAKLLRRYLHDLGVTKLPATLDGYQRDVVTATLERQHAAGAVAIKFEAAYLRTLDFASVDSSAAASIYARYSNGGVPTHIEYKLLQDYLVRFISRESGRLGMAVQIHSTDGFGGFYSPVGAAPHLLESLFHDATLRNTNFVIIHGGWPLVEETMSQLAKHNVYADISMMDQLAEPAALTRTLRMWLAAWPEKVMFGTDAFDAGAGQGWEQVAWVASHNARHALSDALTGMVRDGEITTARAQELARMVLRENAKAAYQLGGK
jgi:uncharacterized protein